MITQDDVQGHWLRHWIKAPGHEDHTTRVHWMQVGDTYADVRIPLDRPDLSAATCLGDLSPSQLAALAQAEGFSGHVTLEDDTCTWQREINWHGTPDALDVGAISFDDEGRMIEVGAHAEYTELWENQAQGTPLAVKLSGEGYLGYLVARGDTFVLGIGRPEKPATKPLLEALQQGEVPDGIETLFDGIHATGRWREGAAVATLATTPFLEGTSLARLDGDTFTWHRAAFDGTRSDVTLSAETQSA